jgi:hypothetical protein
MPLCPQITLTPVTVTSSNMTVASVIAGGEPATFEQLSAADAAAQQALAEASQAITDAAAALAEAEDAYDEAVAANTAASTAQATANGKNKVTYSTSTPGSTANTAGDIWYQYGTTAPNVGRIIAQYMGAGGTSWTQTTVSGLVVANIDAGSITTGTLNVGIGITGPTNSFAVNAVTGVLTATGVNITGTVVATTGTFTGTVTATTGSFTGSIFSTNGTIGGWAITSTSIQKVVGTRTTTFNGSDGLISIYDSNTGFLAGGALQIGTPSVTTSFYSAGMTMGTAATIDVLNELGGYSGILRIYAPANKYIRLVPNAGLLGNTYPVYCEGSLDVLGRIQLNGNLNAPNIPSTTSAANVRWTTGGTGQFQYVTSSSIRFKDNITDITNVPGLDPKALLGLPVRAFTYKPDHINAEDDRFDVMVPGFIAEEVDAVYPIATDYDENGPVSWNDRFIVPALLSLVQDLYKEVEALKGGN